MCILQSSVKIWSKWTMCCWYWCSYVSAILLELMKKLVSPCGYQFLTWCYQCQILSKRLITRTCWKVHYNVIFTFTNMHVAACFHSLQSFDCWCIGLHDGLHQPSRHTTKDHWSMKLDYFIDSISCLVSIDHLIITTRTQAMSLVSSKTSSPL